ncbi:FAD-dependent oxidoreductase [Hyphococcus sp. DH-69]|uniref:FAD-dependent oxidoreductase n=1 Tax=Hyphococcus formosus TaxID=3143534 RepID=UPI00398BB4A3
MSDTDILIVGAGPTGLACALELSRRGIKPRIIDKGDGFTPEAESRALGINNRSLQLLAPSGVSAELLAQGIKGERIRVRNEKGRDVISAGFDHPGALYPFILILPQGRTERILADALKQYGVAVEWNREVIAANGNPKKPVLDVNAPDGLESIRANKIIGADGASSSIRNGFGFSFTGDSYPTEFSLVDIETEKPLDATEMVVDFSGGHLLARIPLGGNVFRFISPHTDIKRILPKDLATGRVIWQSSFHINFRHVEKMQRGSVFLAGDAAHIHSPIGARGMNLGIEDACWLAWMIHKRTEANYSKLRLPHVRMVIKQTRQQTDALLHLGGVGRFARDHLANIFLKIPAFKKRALTRVTGLDTQDPPWIED